MNTLVSTASGIAIAASLLFAAPHQAHAGVNECITEFDTLRPNIHEQNIVHCQEAWHVYNAAPQPPVAPSPPRSFTVPMYDIPGVENNLAVVTMVGTATYAFTVDTGCSNMTVSPALADWLVSTNQASSELASEVVLADGRHATLRHISVYSVSLANHTIHNVLATVVAPGVADGDMLLGVGVLKRFGRFTFDAINHQLTFG